MASIKKITFIGDIMCEPLLLKAAYKDGIYDFTPVFAETKDLFAEADYVVGNLETPVAGNDAGFTDSLFVFNTPEAFVDAVKNAGIHLVLTANNHCLDRGIEGLKHTLEVLDEKNLAHTGTYRQMTDDPNAYCRVGDTRIGIVSYTYGTNYSGNRLLLDEQQAYMVNLLRPQQEFYYVPKKIKKTFFQRVIGKFLRMFPEEKRYYVKKYLGMRVNVAHADDHLNVVTSAPYIEQMKKNIALAKSKADIVLFCPHVGGQFNLEPGAFSKYVVEKAYEAGCDAVVASHAHVVQRAELLNGIPCFFSLGNFSMSPNSVYLLHEHLPDYGLAVHFYIRDKKITKVTFSILKIIESQKECLTVWPSDVFEQSLKTEKEKDRFYREIRQIYETVTGNPLETTPVQKEYNLYDFS